jgi:protein SCO1
MMTTPAIGRMGRRRCLRRLAGLGAAWGWAPLALPSIAAVPPAAEGFYANFQGLRLKDHDGRALDITRLSGRVCLVNFVYTGCSTTCPIQTRALADMQRQFPRPLSERVRILSISLDPLQDTPAALKDFAKRMGADLSGWTFATGRPQDIERVSNALRLFRPGTDVRKPADHSTALWLVDAQGQLRMRYAGNPPDVPRLLREIAALDALTNRT